MLENFEFIKDLESFIPMLRTIIIVIILIVIFNFVLSIIKRRLLKRAKTKKQISNIKIFSRIFKYIFLLIILLFAIFSYSGSWTSLGLVVGLLSAALGWALQRPITGIAAWIMIVSKRPFEIGDRVIIGDVRGDVTDITLTHIYIQEIGGIVAGEENSGRVIMVPNSVLFERNIINYTLQDEYVLDQVVFTVTYGSNLENAGKIGIEVAKKYTKDFSKEVKEEPYVRTFFQPSGINIHIRYFALAKNLQEIESNITKEIHNKILKERNVEIAYPHTEVLLKKKN